MCTYNYYFDCLMLLFCSWSLMFTWSMICFLALDLHAHLLSVYDSFLVSQPVRIVFDCWYLIFLFLFCTNRQTNSPDSNWRHSQATNSLKSPFNSTGGECLYSEEGLWVDYHFKFQLTLTGNLPLWPSMSERTVTHWTESHSHILRENESHWQ